MSPDPPNCCVAQSMIFFITFFCAGFVMGLATTRHTGLEANELDDSALGTVATDDIVSHECDEVAKTMDPKWIVRVVDMYPRPLPPPAGPQYTIRFDRTS